MLRVNLLNQYIPELNIEDTTEQNYKNIIPLIISFMT